LQQGVGLLGIEQAVALVLEHVPPVGEERVPLAKSVHRVVARDLHALVDSPSVNASLKDGYALRSKDVESASPERPVSMKLRGLSAAGSEDMLRVAPGEAVRVLTGARIPEHADAVLSEEFAVRRGDQIEAFNVAEPGRNVLQKGTDVRIGQRVAAGGRALTPGLVGLLAAAGHSAVLVHSRPSVAIIATGDEVVLPGRPLPEGKLYASNLATLDAWCKRYRFGSRLEVVGDDPGQLGWALERAVAEADAVLTSGGAWTGDRDMVMRVLERLGWRRVFHRVRIGPGKAVGFGMLKGKPVFTLPGGPPSNLTAFLQVALPGLLKQSGRSRTSLPTLSVRMAEDVHGRSPDWTQYLFGRLEQREPWLLFHPLRGVSRLRDMAEAQAVAAIPEGVTTIPGGATVTAQWLM